MARLTGGEALVQSLIAQGIKTLYALPGVQNDGLFTALYDARDSIDVIHTRHEQGAAYMALGAALSNGRPAAYNVVPGPGVLNTLAALSTAYSTNARVLCLTGQIESNKIGRGFGLLHEIPDQLGILRSLSKWAARIDSPYETPALVHEAFHQMLNGRPRPVALEVAPDVLTTSAEVRMVAHPAKTEEVPVDGDAIDRAAELLCASVNPLIVVGSGAFEARAEVQYIAELLEAPVVANRMGIGVLRSDHPMSLRGPEAYDFWPKVDVVVAIGARMTDQLQTWGYDQNLKIIRIDIDATEHKRVVPSDISLVADARRALQELIPAIERRLGKRESRAEEYAALRAQMAKRAAMLEPQLSFVKVIRDELPEDGFFVEEMSQIPYVARYALPIYHPRTYVSVGYQGTLGWGFATALGVKVANPDKAVLSVSGDGGFMFTVQELATAVQHGINTVSLVFNDGAYGNVQRMQKQLYGNRVIASDLHNPDFVKLAESFGAQGLRANSPEELRQALRLGFKSNVPTVIEVPVGEMPSPWGLFYPERNRALKP
jgi:acetolactate synthase-1/2/3 large subunit